MKKVDACLSGIESKLGLIEKANSQMQTEISGLKEASNCTNAKLSKVEFNVKSIKDDFDLMDLEFEELPTGQKYR